MTSGSVESLKRERERWPESGDDDTRPGAAPAVIRSEIVSSWRRSKLCGVAPTGNELPFRPDVTRADRLMRAAGPVLDRLADQLGGGAATVVLADADARVIDRRAESRDLNKALDRVLVAPRFCYAEEHAGTNGIGSVLEAGGPIVVAGSEHFRDNLQDFTCVGAPIRSPSQAAILGVLDVTCRFVDTNDLMKPFVAAAAREIESRLAADASLRERLLLEKFLTRARRATGAVVTLNDDFVIANTAASQLLAPADHAVLRDWAARALWRDERTDGELALGDDVVVRARARRLHLEDDTIGVLIELKVSEAAADPSPPSPACPRPRTPAAPIPRADSCPAGA